VVVSMDRVVDNLKFDCRFCDDYADEWQKALETGVVSDKCRQCHKEKKEQMLLKRQREILESTKDIYIIQDEDKYKVGIAKDMHRRMYAYKTHSPRKIDVVNVYENIPYAKYVEHEIHEILSEYRVHGEWFACSYDTIMSAVHNTLDKYNMVA
jgi:CO dehydrogenase/acetyl-CoA synthase gamma subunit (corrinoid Fe-S protein)